MSTTTASTSAAQPQEARLAQRPEVSPPPAWSFPKPEIFKLDNGIEVRAFNMPGKGLAYGALELGTSVFDDPAGAEGLSTVAMRTLSEGTTELSGVEFANAIDELGAEFGPDITHRGAAIHFSAPSSRLDGTLRLVASALTAPRFADDDVSRTVSILVQTLMMRRADPSSLAFDALDAAYFPAGSRAAISALGTEESLGSITPDQVRSWYADHVGPQGAILAICGDFAGLDLRALLNTTLGAWTAPDASGTGEQKCELTGPVFRVIDFPDSPQSEIMIAWPSVSRDSEWWADLKVAVSILGGGGMDSWLQDVIRNEKGYTYGIGARVDVSTAVSRVQLGTAVESSVTGPALVEILGVLKQAKGDGFDLERHERTVDQLVASNPLDFQSGRTLARAAGSDARAGLPLDYRDHAISAVAATTPASAQAGFVHGVDHERPVLVVVGDSDQILEQLAAAEIVEVFGQPVVVRD